MLPRRFSGMSPRCRKRMLQQRLKKIPNETRSESKMVKSKSKMVKFINNIYYIDISYIQ